MREITAKTKQQTNILTKTGMLNKKQNFLIKLK